LCKHSCIIYYSSFKYHHVSRRILVGHYNENVSIWNHHNQVCVISSLYHPQHIVQWKRDAITYTILLKIILKCGMLLMIYDRSKLKKNINKEFCAIRSCISSMKPNWFLVTYIFIPKQYPETLSRNFIVWIISLIP
jgi:hypothetical protein